MGKNKKEVSQEAYVEASKNNIHGKKDFSNWIKVLRPKVYITDSSNFKRLVQDLTGNGTSSEPSRERSRIEKVPIIDIYDQDQGEPESSLEVVSIGATTDSSDDNNQVFLDQDFNRVSNQNGLEDIMYLGNSEADQQVHDLLAYWDIESWLLESTDPCTSLYNGTCG
ncbi:hypothetical protein L484_020932 [Morus notabilis]|uniref:VQ domain-containing protein n=1 Tax=Morus notabilis TaxID=981085 RepID=W9QZR5_9ROSA|nr:hypothetical protein L484_020932 [Morus notabilis]